MEPMNGEIMTSEERKPMTTAEAGRLGAAARIANTTHEQRSEAARKAAVRRWREYRKQKAKKSS